MIGGKRERGKCWLIKEKGGKRERSMVEYRWGSCFFFSPRHRLNTGLTMEELST